MAPEVRVSGPNNEAIGILSLAEALRMAGELDVDLVEISPTAVPPVCRLMDYGKFKYQEQKKAAEAKSKQKVIEVKEIKFRPGTDDGDYNIKLRNIKRFLDDGDKCKITLRFRGREITHQEIGMALLQRIRDELADLIVVEQFPKLEGRQMVMMIAIIMTICRPSSLGNCSTTIRSASSSRILCNNAMPISWWVISLPLNRKVILHLSPSSKNRLMFLNFML